MTYSKSSPYYGVGIPTGTKTTKKQITTTTLRTSNKGNTTTGVTPPTTTLLLVALTSFYFGRLSNIIAIQTVMEKATTTLTTTYASSSCDDNSKNNNNNSKNNNPKTLRRKQQQQHHQSYAETQQKQHETTTSLPLMYQNQKQHQTIDLLPHLQDCLIDESNLNSNSNSSSLPSLSDLAKIYKPTKFVGFAHTNYDRIYPQYLEAYRSKQFRMLEIGLDTGNGSLLWKQYFPCATIYGLEYLNGKTQTEGAKNIHRAIQGDQSDAEYLQTTFLNETDGGNFDIIIDDGGHHYEQQSTSYQILFEKALNPGGLYIIEDIETSYWEPGSRLYGKVITRGGCKGTEDTIINKFKQLVDVINKKFFDYTYTVFGRDVDYWVATITFMSNLIILTKKDTKDCHSELHQYAWPLRLDKSCPARYQTSSDIISKVIPSSLIEYCGGRE